MLIVLSCTSGATFELHTHVPETQADPELEPPRGSLPEAQRASLGYVFYRGNDLPRPPSKRELARLERDLAEAPPVEVEELRELFGDDQELLVYATRDTDGDGVFDYRISEYRGKFFEGDIDLDGDGIRNVFDVAPYNRKVGGKDTDGDLIPDEPGSFADADGDGIPDHLDWSKRKPEPLASVQAGLFRDFDVILVERNARFSPELVRAFDDVLRLLYREPLPTLRTIAVEEQLLIDPDLGDNGFMLGQTQTLSIFTKSIEGAPPLVLLGLVAHEIDHAWQLALDFDGTNLREENNKLHFPAGLFTRSLERFGWTVDERSLGGGYEHRLYWPHFYATSPKYLFRGDSPAAWQAWMKEIEQEEGSGFLSDPRISRFGFIGPYSLTSPWEWHADHLMASLYNRMDRSLAKHPNPGVAKSAALLRVRMYEAVNGQWHRFDYRNAVGSGIERALASEFPLTDEELIHLTNRYVIPLVDLPVLASALALDGQTLLDGDVLGGAWQQFSAHVRDPFQGAATGAAAELEALLRENVGPWGPGSHATDSGSEADAEEDPEASASDPEPEPSEAPSSDEGTEPSGVPSESEPRDDAGTVQPDASSSEAEASTAEHDELPGGDSAAGDRGPDPAPAPTSLPGRVPVGRLIDGLRHGIPLELVELIERAESLSPAHDAGAEAEAPAEPEPEPEQPIED